LTSPTIPSSEQKSFLIHNQNLGLSFRATPRRRRNDQTKEGHDQLIEKKKDLHVVVIGAGMMGSSIALALSSSSISSGQMIRVTVLDRLPLHVDGETTMGSWAWINSNEKGAPSPYHTLNCLGMLAWHRCSVVQPFGEWTGSLVRRRTPIHYGGHYRAKGPLLHDPINNNNNDDDDDDDTSFFSSQHSDNHDSNVYYYPDEGCVDPGAAVRAMRSKAIEQGATFIGNAHVTNLIRQPENGPITGVTYTSSSGDNEDDTTITNHTIDSIDVVVVAGGVGSGDPVLGELPLLHSPGAIAYAKPNHDDNSSHPRLKRILVDTIRESHVLQRADGTVLVGGGFLVVGGAASAQARHDLPNTPSSATTNTTDERIMGDALLHAATPLAAPLLNRVSLTATVSRNRPMPADGFPAIGRHVDDDNLYYAVTHSGVTLSPLLGELVAMELTDNVHCHLLESFRPSRLFQNASPPDDTEI
jgi:glycine/D-amino acid oxidase-like deaminating enzyme